MAFDEIGLPRPYETGPDLPEDVRLEDRHHQHIDAFLLAKSNPGPMWVAPASSRSSGRGVGLAVS